MKSFILISRLLLGLTFTVFGLNGFLHLIKLPPPAGIAGQFMEVLIAAKYLFAVCALETVAGVLLLVNRFVPLALAILAPILVNIALYHLLLAPEGAGAAVVSIALWALLAYRERAAWAALWSPKGVS